MSHVSTLQRLKDYAAALTASNETQLVSRLLGMVVKKTNASPGSVTLATDEVLLGPSYKDMLVQLGAAPVGTAQPPSYGRFLQNTAGTMQGVYGWKYSGTAENEQFVDVQMQHDWRKGTTIFPHVHVSPDTAPGTSATSLTLWGFEHSIQTVDGGAFPNTSVVYGASLLETTAKDHRICPLTSEDVGLSMAGMGISSIIKGRLFRPKVSAIAAWAANTAYVQGNGGATNPDIIYAVIGGRMYFFQCTTSGTSGNGSPPPTWNTSAIGATTNDNTVVWTYICLAPATATALYSGDVWAHYMDIHYQVDGLGSDGVFSKQY